MLPPTLLVVPDNVLKQTQTLRDKFLWGSRDKVKRLKVIQDIKQGGLNMVDVKILFKSFKAGWITKLAGSDPSIHSWYQLPNLYFKYFSNCNIHLKLNFDSDVEFCFYEIGYGVGLTR